jgi:hypothetical protein
VSTAFEESAMSKEAKLLNLICLVCALLFVAFAVATALFFPPLLSTDNLFIIMVCMVMALMFAINPLLYLKDEGKLPIPFRKKKLSSETPQLAGATTPPLLDAKGRAMPADVRSMVANMSPKQPKDS